MAITTTTIGSYPKPDYLRIPLFQPKHPDPTRQYAEYLERLDDSDLERLQRATTENVQHQVDAGIDIPTDGETPRSHYVHYHLWHLDGIDFAKLTEKTKRGGAWKARFPTITSKVSARDPFLPDDYRRAQAATDRPVKMTVPGPMTIIDSTADTWYHDDRQLAEDLAIALNQELHALAKAGCRHIQIDEPVFARQSDLACDWGIALLDTVFDGLPPTVNRVVHICCGYPSALDMDDFPKAPREAYFAMADLLNAAAINTISIEDAHRFNDLSLLERFSNVAVILGVVQIANTHVESTEAIYGRLVAALEHIDASRLIAGPDCGLAMLPRELVFNKLKSLCDAASQLHG